MTEKQRKKIESTFYAIGGGAIVILLVAWMFYKKLGISMWDYTMPCVFWTITGMYCPGCGGTRAVEALLLGRIITSFLYHPIVVYTAAVCGWFMVSHTIEKLTKGKLKIGMHYRNAYLWIALFLIAVNVVVKNAALFIWDMDLFTLISQS